MAAVDVNNLQGFLGARVLVEVKFDDCPDSHWHLGTVVGFCTFVPGVYELPHLLLMPIYASSAYPEEFFLCHIASLKVVPNSGRLLSA